MVMRIFKSLAGGIFIPVVFFVSSQWAERSNIPWLERAAVILFYIVIWPLFITEWLFPPPPACPSCHPTMAAIYAAIILDFFLAALFTYVALWFYEKGRPVSSEVIVLNIQSH